MNNRIRWFDTSGKKADSDSTFLPVVHAVPPLSSTYRETLCMLLRHTTGRYVAQKKAFQT